MPPLASRVRPLLYYDDDREATAGTTATVQGTFGNPVGRTTSYAICVYDQGATLRA